MLNKKTLIKVISFSIHLLVFLSCVYFLTLLSKDACVLWEDLNQIFFKKSDLISFYREADHGCLISWIVMKFFGSYFPLSFNMHPNDNIVGDIFKASVISVIPLIISRFALLLKNTPKFSLFCYLNAVLIFFAACFVDSAVYYHLVLYSKNCRYLFTMVFYLLFWLGFMGLFLGKKEASNKNIVWLSILAFIVGLSVEPINLSTFFSLSIFWMYYVFQKLKYKEIFPKFIFYVTTFFTLGLFVFYLSPSFWNIADRERGLLSVSKIVLTITVSFSEFIKKWVDVVFISDYRWLFLLIILLLSVCFLFFKKNENDIKIIFCSWSLVVGVAIFNFTLIAAGRTYYDGNSFWLESIDLKADTLIIFITSIFIFFGGLINKFEYDKSKKNIIMYVFQVFIILTFIYFGSLGKQIFSYKMQHYKQTRQLMYKLEKIYVFYSLKNKVALMPLSIINDHDLKFTFLGIIEDEHNKGTYSNLMYPKFAMYYKSIYQGNRFVKIKLVKDDIAMKEFYSEGGTFYPGEIERTDFSKLLNKDFVLNKAVVKR